MYTDLTPLFDRVLIRRIEPTGERTVGGIIIPDAAQEKSQVGEVVAVGSGKVTAEGKTLPLSVKKGDRVIFAKYAGADIEKDMLIVREDDILGIVRN